MGVAILHIDEIVATEEPAASAVNGPMRLAVRPNPMRATGEIAFEVPAGGATVELAVYDARGRRVRKLLRLENANPGPRSVVWDGRNDEGIRMPNGVYFARAQVGQSHETRKLTLLW